MLYKIEKKEDGWYLLTKLPIYYHAETGKPIVNFGPFETEEKVKDLAINYMHVINGDYS